jgi:hypothetical protein
LNPLIIVSLGRGAIPQVFDASLAAGVARVQQGQWGTMHMIPADLARAARMLSRPSIFDEE